MVDLTKRSEQKPEAHKVAAASKPTPKKLAIKKVAAKKAAVKRKPAKKTQPRDAKDREKTSKRYEREYQAKLAKVRADIDANKLIKFTATKSKEYGLHNARFTKAKKDLKDQGYLVQVNKTYYAKTAQEVMPA